MPPLPTNSVPFVPTFNVPFAVANAEVPADNPMVTFVTSIVPESNEIVPLPGEFAVGFELDRPNVRFPICRSTGWPLNESVAVDELPLPLVL